MSKKKTYPRYEDYDGGGSILNGHTSVRNVIFECGQNGVLTKEVFRLLCKGMEIIIMDGRIRGVHPYSDVRKGRRAG